MDFGAAFFKNGCGASPRFSLVPPLLRVARFGEHDSARRTENQGLRRALIVAAAEQLFAGASAGVPKTADEISRGRRLLETRLEHGQKPARYRAVPHYDAVRRSFCVKNLLF